MDEAQFETWLAKLVRSYPEVGRVSLVGSRCFGCARPESDWDVIVYLWDECYVDREKADELERRITWDPRLKRKEIDLFFLGPEGCFSRWAWADRSDVARLETELAAETDMSADMRDHILGHFKGGTLAGDFSRLYRSISSEKIVFSRPKMA